MYHRRKLQRSMFLTQEYPYDPTPLAIPVGEVSVRVYYPMNRTYTTRADSWKYLWEATVPLAKNIYSRNLSGKTICNINCGLGMISTAARLAGATKVYAVDTYEECKFFVSLNARSNAAGGILVQNTIPETQFDVTAGADTMYMLRGTDEIQSHIHTLMSTVAQDGVLLLAETQWMGAEEKIKIVHDMEYEVNTIYTEELYWWDTPEEKRWSKQVYIHQIQHR
jgi:predicted nicotinamide N-methyase